MGRNDIHRQIGSLLEKLGNTNRELENKAGDLSLLETDLMKHYCLELYDAIQELLPGTKMEFIPPPEPVLNESTPPVIQEEPKPEIEAVLLEEEEIVSQPVVEEIPLPEPEEKVIKEIKLEETAGEEILDLPVSYDLPKFVPVTERPTVTPQEPAVKKEAKNVLEKISETSQKKTLHDTISTQKEEKLNETFSGYKLSRITDAIDISKRFELQNNLFGGNAPQYMQAISSLDEAKSKFSALDIFNQLAERYNWDMKSELVHELRNFIHRRF